MHNVQTMAKFNAWANERIYGVCADLSDEDYRMDRQVFFGSIHHTLNHLLVVDRLWLARMNGDEDESIKSLADIIYQDFDELRSARVTEDRILAEFTDALDDATLEKTIQYRRMSGEDCENTLNEVLITLFNHQTHHRGQVHAMLTQSGIESSQMPDIDVIDYLQVAEPAC